MLMPGAEIAPVKGVFASLTPIAVLGSGMRFAFLDAWILAEGAASRKVAATACVLPGNPVPTVLEIVEPATRRAVWSLPLGVARGWPSCVARAEHSPFRTV